MPVVLTLPSEKGSRLNHIEMEKNLTDLRDSLNLAKYETDITNEANYTAGVKQVILMDATAGEKVVNLPPVADSLDKVYVIKKVDSTPNFVIIDGDGVEEIEHNLTRTLQVHNESLTIICDGVRWNVITHQKGGDKSVGTKLVTTTVENTAVETQVYSHTFPADFFTDTGHVSAIVSGAFSTDVNNAGFNVIVKMNGVPVHTLSRTGSIKTNAGWELKVSGTIRSIGASGTYVDTAILIDGENVSASASPAEVPIDTTASFLYEVYVQWDTAAIGSVLQCTQGRIEVGG